jgi:RimJ/RimL family protein N-acetyltransferase
MTSARDYHADEKLRDGTPVALRAVRPDDRPRLVEAFNKLGAETLYTRFFSSKHSITDADLSQGIDVDFVRNVTLVVTLGPGETIIGAGRYIGIGDGPEAEVAFTVEEDFHGQGIATLLLDHLVRIGRTSGFARFSAEVLAGNRSMLRVFERSGLPMTKSRDEDVVHVTLSLGG